MTYRICPPLLSLVAAGCLLGAPLAQAETPLGINSASEAKAMYKHDTEACRSGAVQEDRKTCMLEAKRAYEQALQEAGVSHKARHTKKEKAAKAEPTK
jgi:hypothetical protein